MNNEGAEDVQAQTNAAHDEDQFRGLDGFWMNESFNRLQEYRQA